MKRPDRFFPSMTNFEFAGSYELLTYTHELEKYTDSLESLVRNLLKEKDGYRESCVVCQTREWRDNNEKTST